MDMQALADRWLSKKLGALVAILTLIARLPLPPELHAKYISAVGIAYLIVQGMSEIAEKVWGIKADPAALAELAADAGKPAAPEVK